MIWLRTFLAALLLALPAQAEDIVADLSQTRVSITSNFDGSEILIFGAIRRHAPQPEGPMAVVITVEGPSEPAVVRRKARVFGLWVNAEAVTVNRAPSFYAIATTVPLREAINETEDLRHKVSIPRAIRAVGMTEVVADSQSFIEALVRIRTDIDLYQLLENQVTLSEETLFNTAISLPSNLVEGDYRSRIFITRGGEVVDLFETEISVRKVGLERFIYTLAHDQPLVYGLLSLMIAIAAGWMASAFFRYIRS